MISFIRLVVLAAGLGAALLLSSCSGGRMKATGPYLTLPRGSYLAEHFAKLQINGAGEGNAFKKFDGRYPAGWPAAIRLPEGVYLAQDGQITVESIDQPSNDGRYLSAYPVAGVLKGSYSEVLSALRTALSAGGGPLSMDQAVPPGKHAKSSMDFPAGHELSWSAGTSTFAPRLSLRVFDSPELDGWTYFEGYFSSGE